MLSAFIFAALLSMVMAQINPIGPNKPCAMDVDGGLCEVDEYVGSSIIFEDDSVRVWNFTLAPGAMTSMHSHDYPYHFIAIKPTQLEVWGVDGEVLFDFRAEGVLGFDVQGDFLVPTGGISLPFPVPRIHAAKNIGPDYYYEILYENKYLSKDRATQQTQTQEL